jgi:hypothetical protein
MAIETGVFTCVAYVNLKEIVNNLLPLVTDGTC